MTKIHPQYIPDHFHNLSNSSPVNNLPSTYYSNFMKMMEHFQLCFSQGDRQNGGKNSTSSSTVAEMTVK